VAQYRADLEARMVPAGAPPPSTPAPVGAARDARPAGFWIRGVALAIDGAVILGAYGALVLIAKLVFRDAAEGKAVQATLQIFKWLGTLAYFSVLTWQFGRTLGKAALRLRVVTAREEPVSFGRAVGRVLAHGVSIMIFGIGYLIAGVRSDKRALHDLIAGTRVERV
jgi:uncharacterized RDD family membrane protein YckC